jgi:hypothetical protein
MNDLLPLVLRAILVEQGPVICDEPQRLKGLLQDVLGQEAVRHKRPLNVLLLALTQRLVPELLDQRDLPGEVVRQRAALRLHMDLAITWEAADRAVVAWGFALGLWPIDGPSGEAAPLSKPSEEPIDLPLLDTADALVEDSATTVVPDPELIDILDEAMNQPDGYFQTVAEVPEHYLPLPPVPPSRAQLSWWLLPLLLVLLVLPTAALIYHRESNRKPEDPPPTTGQSGARPSQPAQTNSDTRIR